MKATDFKKKRTRSAYRALEIIPGILSWGTLAAAIIFSFWQPVMVAVFIICFDLYWLIKVTYLSVYLISSYRRLNINLKINWIAKAAAQEKFKAIHQLVIIPTYKEGIEVLKTTFTALEKANYPKDKIIVVLAIEERDKKRGLANAQLIENQFGHLFKKFLVTTHPANIPGELAGKGSNQTWAAREAKKYIDDQNIPYENVILSVFDVDTCVHPNYFAHLTYKFLTLPNPHQTSYQPIPMFFNNIWDSPALMRIIALSHTFWMLMEQGRPERLTTFSSHSMSFKTIVDIGFWETDVVSEDSRIFWQCFIHFNGQYRCEPLFVPVYMDTVLADKYTQSIANQYKQQRRWAWGVENIPYLVYKFRRNPKIPLRKKAKHLFSMFEGFHSWATNSLMIFGLGWLPLLLGGEKFNDTLLAQSLPKVTQSLMTLAMIGMIVSAALGLMILPKRPSRHKRNKFALMVFQWFLLPFSTICLGAFPALESQTRLMLGKYMGFWVTKKVRKS